MHQICTVWSETCDLLFILHQCDVSIYMFFVVKAAQHDILVTEDLHFHRYSVRRKSIIKQKNIWRTQDRFWYHNCLLCCWRLQNHVIDIIHSNYSTQRQSASCACSHTWKGKSISRSLAFLGSLLRCSTRMCCCNFPGIQDRKSYFMSLSVEEAIRLCLHNSKIIRLRTQI